MKDLEGVDFAAYVGIDWGDSKHDICLKVRDRAELEQSIVRHTPEAIGEWARALRRRCRGEPVAVCVEIARGPLVSALLMYDFLVIFPVNPQSLALYRRAWAPSGAKDDPSDARLALEVLTRHRDKLAPLRSESVEMRALRQLVEDRRRLVNDRVRVTNRLTAALKRSFPQVLDLFRDKGTIVFSDFVEKWPSVGEARRARKATLEQFFQRHNVRGQVLIEKRINCIKTATPLTDDPGVVGPARLMVLALAPQLRLLVTTIATYDKEIRKACSVLQDYRIFASFPGAAAALTPRLLVAFGEDRERYANAGEMQQHSGISPVTERSGNKCWVYWRYRCPTFLRQTFVEWAGQTVPRSAWAEAFYRQQRAKGAAHRTAIRALAYKWIRIMYRCWKDRIEYDEAKYLKALVRRGSPLAKSIAPSSQSLTDHLRA